MGKLALLLELCQGLSSTAVNWYPTCGNGHRGPRMIYASSGLECWNQSESQVSQNRAEQPGIRQPSQHSLNVPQTCLKNIKFPDYDHLMMTTPKNKTGTEADIWEQLRLKLALTDVTLDGDHLILTDFWGGWLWRIFVPVGREAPADRWRIFPAARRALPLAARRWRTPVFISALSGRVDHTRQWEKNGLGLTKLCWAWLK